MGANSKIQWTNDTWNPWTGCEKVSQGCKNCYMYTAQNRYGQDPTVVRRSKPATFNSPLAKLKGPLVFTCSWSDFFIEQADPWRADAWDIIRRTPHLTYQILTKRPERVLSALCADLGGTFDAGMEQTSIMIDQWLNGTPPKNVWIGTTVEDQENAERRIIELRRIPACVRFLSCEPLIGPVNLFTPATIGVEANAADCRRVGMPFVDWVICGGESGPRARPMHPQWARSLRDQCVETCVPFFFKQWGEWLPFMQMTEALIYKTAGTTPGFIFADGADAYRIGKSSAGRLLDGREHNEFPKVGNS